MANTKSKNKVSSSSKSNKKIVKSEKRWNIKSQAAAVILFGVSILLLFVILIKGENIWNFLHKFILGTFGFSAILWPVIIMYISINAALGKINDKIIKKVWLSGFLVFIFSMCIYIFTSEYNPELMNLNYLEKITYLYANGAAKFGAGFFGGLLGIPLIMAFGYVCSKIVVLILLIVFSMLLTEIGLVQVFSAIKSTVNKCRHLLEKIKKDRLHNKIKENNLDEINLNEVKLDEPANLEDSFDALKNAYQENNKGYIEPNLNKEKIIKSNFPFSEENKNLKDGQYKYPPSTLLMESVKQNRTTTSEETNQNGAMLVNTLNSFSVQTKIINISRGPAVTRYEIQPAAGVKISKITNLADDIALNLAANGVRIEAPIPGKAAVGVEIPNKIVDIVKMRELINSSEFINASSKLSVVLGRDITGNTVVADLAKMPHLLIAGSTGSGKSVCINSFIISLLYKAKPEEVRLLMIDPKVVELGIYNGIKHLLVPVVTDPCKAAGALNWAVTEMLKRYKIFAENNVRDLSSYNEMVKKKAEKKSFNDENKLEPLPQIVIIIDELADLMMAAPNEVEDAICRLAQMARAAGMHLVIATQRPSVDVITGIIKANIPSRIALAVSSQVDSRTILDSSGAEKLLGRGDMLFSPIGSQKPIRVQGCYVTDSEIESVINFIKTSGDHEYDQEVIEEIEKNAAIEKSGKDMGMSCEGEDPLLKDAIRCILDAGQASTSHLQRKLRVGYARAGRLMDEMEQRGIVGARDGSKPRQIMMTMQQLGELEMRFMDE